MKAKVKCIAAGHAAALVNGKSYEVVRTIETPAQDFLIVLDGDGDEVRVLANRFDIKQDIHRIEDKILSNMFG